MCNIEEKEKSNIIINNTQSPIFPTQEENNIISIIENKTHICQNGL